MDAAAGTETLLSADEIAARLAIYDPQRDFSDALAELWRDAQPQIVAATEAHWRGVLALPHNADLSPEGKAAMILSAIESIVFRFTAPFDEHWIAQSPVWVG